MYAKVSVTFGNTDRIVIPDMAVVKQSGTGQKFVFVLEDDGTVTMTPVTLGRHMGAEYEVIEGLSEGATIITKGHATLRTGDKVEVKA